MKKLMTFMIAVVIMAAGVSQAAEKKCSSVGDAEDRWNFNMKSEALACLDEIITADPANAKAHFLKGKYCFATGNYGCARERFAAGPVKAKYANEIAGLYKSAGDARLNAGDVKQAEEFYLEAGNYNSAISKETADNLFAQGKAAENDNFLYLAGRLNPALKQAIGDYYYDLSKAALKTEDKIRYKGKAAEHDNRRVVEYKEDCCNQGRFHLDRAKELAKTPGKEKVTAERKASARDYFRQCQGEAGVALVEQELPVERIYQPGTYIFSLKSGEQTESWITFPSGVTSNWNLDSPDGKFQAIYDDGEIVNLWSATSLPRNKYKFRLRAVTDQPAITMVVSQK